MTKNYKKCAKEIYEKIGGQENIQEVTFCKYRLRITVKNLKLVDTYAIEEIDGVLGLFVSNGKDVQLVLGIGTVNKVYDEFIKLYKSSFEIRKERNNNNIIISCEAGEVVAPINGAVIPREKIKDDTFASGVLGEGVGIEPKKDGNIGCIYAPFNGTVTSIADLKHAIGLVSDNGLELLIHVGIDTVEMMGDGFFPLVSEKDKISLGEPLLLFDMEKIVRAGFDTTIVVLLTNSEDYLNVSCKGVNQVFTKREKKSAIRRCSLCKKDENEVKRIISGPEGVFICDECVEICLDILSEAEEDLKDNPDGIIQSHQKGSINHSKSDNKRMHAKMRLCSFCNRPENMMHTLLSGPDGINICDECVGICKDILEEEYEANNANKQVSENNLYSDNSSDNNIDIDEGYVRTVKEIDLENFDDLVENILNSF